MKVLIYTSSSGNGHRSTAKIFKQKFENEYANCEVKITDVYEEYANKLLKWSMSKGYLMACNHIVWAYNMGFRLTEKEVRKDATKSSSHGNIKQIADGMLKEIYDFKPDLILCTYIYTAIAVCDLKKHYNIPAKVACMTLDYGVSPYWECTTNLDYMFITDDYMLEPFMQRGFAREQLYPFGIPVGQNFSKEIDKTEARKTLGLDEKMFTVIIMKGGFFSIKNAVIVKELSKVKKPIQVVLINGRAENSKKELDKLFEKANLVHKIHNIGFTNQVDTYLSACDIVLGKAGGLITTETITKGLPSLIISNLPAQEVYNKKYLMEKGCALSIDSKNTISKVLNKIMDNPEIAEKMHQNALKIRKLNSVDKIYDVLKTIPTADYSKITPPNDSKFEVRRNIDKTLRQEYKEKKKQNKLNPNLKKIKV